MGRGRRKLIAMNLGLALVALWFFTRSVKTTEPPETPSETAAPTGKQAGTTAAALSHPESAGQDNGSKPKAETPGRETQVNGAPLSSPEARDLATFIRDDDICGLLESGAWHSAAPEEELQLLLSEGTKGETPRAREDAPVTTTLFPALFSSDPKDVAAGFDNPSSATGHFLRALWLAGWLTGRPLPEGGVRLADAEAELMAAAELEPKNGAVPFFLAALHVPLQGSGNFDALRGEMRMAFDRSPGFNLHLQSVARELNRLGLASPSRYAVSTDLVSKLPVADFQAPLNLALNLMDGADDSFLEGAIGFGKTIMDRNASRVAGRDTIYWSALEYSAAQKIFNRAWAKRYPGKPVPPGMDRGYRDLVADTKANRTLASWITAPPGTPGVPAECDPRKYLRRLMSDRRLERRASRVEPFGPLTRSERQRSRPSQEEQ